MAASCRLSGLVTYFWTSNLFSNPFLWRLENTARDQDRFRLGCDADDPWWWFWASELPSTEYGPVGNRKHNTYITQYGPVGNRAHNTYNYKYGPVTYIFNCNVIYVASDKYYDQKYISSDNNICWETLITVKWYMVVIYLPLEKQCLISITSHIEYKYCSGVSFIFFDTKKKSGIWRSSKTDQHYYKS